MHKSRGTYQRYLPSKTVPTKFQRIGFTSPFGYRSIVGAMTMTMTMMTTTMTTKTNWGEGGISRRRICRLRRRTKFHGFGSVPWPGRTVAVGVRVGIRYRYRQRCTVPRGGGEEGGVFGMALSDHNPERTVSTVETLSLYSPYSRKEEVFMCAWYYQRGRCGFNYINIL